MRDRDSLQDIALNELHKTLTSQEGFIKVHAAEYLIWLGDKKDPHEVFLEQLKLHGDQPKYRIGIWRVLAESETDSNRAAAWGEHVLSAFGDLNGPDRLHAAETLGKLKISPLARYPEASKLSINDSLINMRLYSNWAISYDPGADNNKFKNYLLDIMENDTDVIARLISSYIVRRTQKLTSDEWLKLASGALAKTTMTPLEMSLLNTAYLTCPDSLQNEPFLSKIKEVMTSHYLNFTGELRIALAQALAEKGNETDLKIVEAYLHDEKHEGIYKVDSPEGADIRAAAAYAIVKIKQRTKK